MIGRPRIGVAIFWLAGVHTLALTAGFVAPYDYAAQHRSLSFAPPSRLRFLDAEGRFHLAPFVYRLEAREGTSTGYREDQSTRYPIRLLVEGAPFRLLGAFTCRRHLFGVDPPARLFLMGSDDYGRDQFSRLLYGSQTTLAAGTLATALSVGIAVILGAIAGWWGGWLDDAIMRLAELFMALPWLYLLFAVRAFLPLHVNPAQAFLLLIAVVGIVGWARPARIVRGVVLSAKQRDFVLAARGLGARDFYLLRRHVLPQASGVILTQAVLLAPQYVLAEVTMSFLGIGVGEPEASWGLLLASLQQYHVIVSYWWMFLPGLFLIPLFLSYQTVARAIQFSLEQSPAWALGGKEAR